MEADATASAPNFLIEMPSVRNDSHTDRRRTAATIARSVALLACCGVAFNLAASSASTAGPPVQGESSSSLDPPQWVIVTDDVGIAFSHEFGGGVGDYVSESGGSGGAWLDDDVDGRLDLLLANEIGRAHV